MGQNFPFLSSDIPHFSLTEIFPALGEGGTTSGQAISQLLAIISTLATAIVGGCGTGGWQFFSLVYFFTHAANYFG